MIRPPWGQGSSHLGKFHQASFLVYFGSQNQYLLRWLKILSMVTFKGMSSQSAGSRITLEGVTSIICPKNQKVIYMIPGSIQKFHDSENEQILEISLLRRSNTGASRFSIKLLTENQNVFLYSEFLKREIGNRIFVVNFESPEGQSTTVFFCQTQASLRENCLVNVAEDIFMKDMKIPQEDVIPKTIIKDLQNMKSVLYFNRSLSTENEDTFLSQKTKIVDI